MKKIITLLFLTFIVKVNAQTDLYFKLKSQLKIEHPEINLENKLIAISVWSPDNSESREANKEFNKVYKTYEFAKLKGGFKGIVCLAINKTGENASIILNKDGVNKVINLTGIDVKSNSSLTNVVFDSQGNEVLKNISHEQIFESIHNLITR
ncbi:MAG: hypothetical protein SFY56_00010 [Bacteroidota bacterium]|nr:hypothetical protein [Bacteroidota bacterium]